MRYIIAWTKKVHIYNIGDVVGQDNIHIACNMSKRRQMLGFYSILIFQTVGFHVIGNMLQCRYSIKNMKLLKEYIAN